MGGMGLVWILLLAALVAVVVIAGQRSRRGELNVGGSAEQTLKRRYASGEIDRETYERMLSDLRM